MRFECGHQVLGVLETMDPTAEGVDSVRQWASDIGFQNHYPPAWTCVDHSVIVVLVAFGHRAREFLDVRIWLLVLEASARLQQALDSHVDL